MKIGITDCLKKDKLQQYLDWIWEQNPDTEFVKLSPTVGNFNEIRGVEGLLLTGGGDVDPSYYGRSELKDRAKDISKQRDEFEFDVIKLALDSDLPILGVCRGMQVMNVALGGSLHVDLKTDGFSDHSGSANGEGRHEIGIEPNSLLSGLAGGLTQEVNSYHHQAVDQLGRGLIKVAESADGVIEAVEWSMKDGMPFLMLVQWHPERTQGNKNVFSENLAKIFVREVEYSIANKAT